MKKFRVYKNIRKRAVIFGLPVSLFALMMISIIASLLIIIFSFRFTVIVGILLGNALLYIILFKISTNPRSVYLTKVFPSNISNKRNSGIRYENN